MKAAESRVPAYALWDDTGSLVPSVASRVAWMRRRDGAHLKDVAGMRAALEFRRKSFSDYETAARETVKAFVESPELDLVLIKRAGESLVQWHDHLRDIAAYEFLIEEAEASNVVRLPVKSDHPQYGDLNQLSPYNRRRALAYIEQLNRKQSGAEESEP